MYIWLTSTWKVPQTKQTLGSGIQKEREQHAILSKIDDQSIQPNINVLAFKPFLGTCHNQMREIVWRKQHKAVWIFWSTADCMTQLSNYERALHKPLLPDYSLTGEQTRTRLIQMGMFTPNVTFLTPPITDIGCVFE